MNLQNLWAPWRIAYIKGLDQPEPEEGAAAGGCFLCEAGQEDLTEQQRCDRLVLLSDDRGTLLLNRYPYTNGHLLVAPRHHVPDLSDLTPAERAGLMELTEVGNRLLKAAMNPQGMNIGMNLGRCAGAGLPGHAHMHIVPRWAGDVNFMESVGGVRVIPQALEETYQTLRAVLAAMD